MSNIITVYVKRRMGKFVLFLYLYIDVFDKTVFYSVSQLGYGLIGQLYILFNNSHFRVYCGLILGAWIHLSEI